MNYDEFIRINSMLGFNTLLPDYFGEIDDEALYSAIEIADVLKMHPESIRRWCRTGQIPSAGVSWYRIKGIELKRFIFKKMYNRLPEIAIKK